MPAAVEPTRVLRHDALVARETLVAIAGAVKEWCARTGESQTDLAKRLGMKQPNLANQLGRLERGEAVTWDTAEKIANAVGYKIALQKKGAKE